MSANAVLSALRRGGNGLAFRASGLRRRRGPWRSRAGILVAGVLLILANAGVLVSYNAFYDVRVRGLAQTREDLTKSREEAQAAVKSVRAAEKRLEDLKNDLETFYGTVLGSRRERLAPLIEEIQAITRKAGFVPATIGYAEDPIPGAERIALTFQVQGRYPDVKKLLHAFESNPGFLVLEAVNLNADEAEDNLRLTLTVAHYFRSESPSAKRPGRSSRAGAPRRPTPAAKETGGLE
jgi:hypothetical protein